ncbi:hypothetical protein JEG43_12150 [Anoxybacillus sp. LAT_35]|uniref:hypothetical protein n=1 Tax=unclassified Anoxybacillus TaxID=2639704 RepID=UPI001EDB5574|nr:hypothetical protein [Anoxybacillus sp. LAT_26]MCG3083630.1 hypothetical protein [Anoxybacillus sp. LAT27]MCG5025271.1 hypothetical protein [Anoxybacillus flavithermus]MCG6171419.1 hypothetical protein [Anoxybacillus sp. LAT_11]MCG6175328.1 hypothetical protein [Anoxybacillus sp. LAT_31]MCG6178760.1 hypothetical protein [Anoxybacillus sp. LAT_35]MCG6179295.1 hypothetical protein [Anoxybacillus sp. LAT_33]MCG6195771.1 hypothetical protein [Anoxybacillus sp. LAT_38]
MKLQDAVYNWLTIKVVAQARPDDTAAQETEQFFSDLLREDHAIEEITYTKEDDVYTVAFTVNNESRTFRFPAELVETMLDQINREPEKYVNYE